MSHHASIRGRIQVKLWYDTSMLQLVVTIIKASLNPYKTGRIINPYIKMYLLPDRSEQSKRRTKTLGTTYEPKWNQTFVYSPYRRSDLHTRTLEITCWNYDRLGNNAFVGEVLIDLSSARMNKDIEWYRMYTREESLAEQLRRSNLFLEAELSGSATSVDHLSPSSSVSASRLSDSDISELDYDETIPVSRRDPRFPCDAGSLSSIGSSPTLVGDDSINTGERRSRRDLWPDDRRRSSTGKNSISITRLPSQITKPSRSRSVMPNDGSLARSRSPPRRVIEANVHRSASPPEARHSISKETTTASNSSTASNKRPNDAQLGGTRKANENKTSKENLMECLQLLFLIVKSHLAIAWTGSLMSIPIRRLETLGCLHTRKGRHRAVGVERGKGPSTSAEGAEKGDQHPRGSRTLQEFTSPTPAFGPVHPTRPTRGSLNRSSSDGAANDKANSGSLSDTALTGSAEKVTKPGQQGATGGKITQFGGLSAKRSNSASQLSVAGHKKRMGFRRKKSSTINVHRSEEVAPLECRHLVKQASSVSSDGEGSLSGDSSVYGIYLMMWPISRTTSISFSGLGDIQLSLADRKGNLEVEVIRARGLQPKPGRVVPVFEKTIIFTFDKPQVKFKDLILKTLCYHPHRRSTVVYDKHDA
ncbi:regulating synaptic membrane exocytosis protein 1 [Caerostris extrusa]|uniref:Regulating synaptic membrane exocytosis protein 1 n=1 Tax=Caerostris extrusa TaxID=172846 RepID=A0AAV4V9Z0_CAEEX|nr:regulating synaptic membrane exocytosis protein 1 [Caerostris extrusa]